VSWLNKTRAPLEETRVREAAAYLAADGTVALGEACVPGAFQPAHQITGAGARFDERRARVETRQERQDGAAKGVEGVPITASEI
jgi:hypothetical protein